MCASKLIHNSWLTILEWVQTPVLAVIIALREFVAIYDSNMAFLIGLIFGLMGANVQFGAMPREL